MQDRLLEALRSYLAVLPSAGVGSDAAQAMEVLQLLRRGRDYLRTAESNRCPICQQEIEARGLLRSLIQRVQDLEQISLQEQSLERLRAELEVAVNDSAARLRTLERDTSALSFDQTRVGDLSNALAMLRESLHSPAAVETREMANRLENALARWLRWTDESIKALEAESQSEAEASPEIDQVRAVLDLLEQVRVRRAQAEQGRKERVRLTEERVRLDSEQARRARALALADRAYATFIHVKNKEIQRVYDEIRADLVRMYDFLHPGEGHDLLSIAMDPNKRGSTELRIGFYDRHDEDPRAFGSEGHLDSLGLCIFLAFVKRFNGDWPLLVLDDVVSSVDIQHKRRVATLLFEEFGDRQLFVTTQDSRWFSELRRAQEQTGHAADTHNVAIEAWSLEEGPRIRMVTSESAPPR
jgi:wobble nucleotide-excising tRNase